MIWRPSLLLIPLVVFGQKTPPPGMEEELRARVTAFYQNFLETSFSPRKAEPFVAEDTKDYFYDAGKEKYISVRVERITFDDSFRKAIVVVVGKTERHMAGQAVIMDVPQDTHWKIENGKWVWTYHPEDYPITPMGGVNPPQATGKMADHLAAVKPKNGSPEEMRKAGMAVLNQQPMGTDKDVVTFVADQAGSAKVVFTNGADGPIQVNLDGPVVRGLKVDLDRKDVPGHQTAVLTFHYDPTDATQEKGMWEPKGSIKFRIYASPFNQVFPVEVQFVGKP